MKSIRKSIFVVALLVASASPALAVDPGEVLKDPVLEARARHISTELRCLVCQNQSIDVSDADLAKDLRVIVRERLTAGDSDKQVFDYIVARYGEFVLLKPTFSNRNLILWGSPFAFVLIGALVLIVKSRGAIRSVEQPSLTNQEQKQLAEIMDKNTID